MRFMGIDLGTRNIGVAVSDESCTIAQGRDVVKRTSDKEAADEIASMACRYGVSGIVVGLPVNMDGSEGERAEDARKFASLLENVSGIDVTLFDERLSTKEAEDILILADMSRAKRRRVIDKMAAQLILQTYLDMRLKG
ncbi:MAG: Holliday junction resolvase RuvX [Candidatus Omnitrophica bacterium]|nr:Holliday junction resolvase RuvX [Candidatus Omnitrophota bacterium]